MDIRNRIVRTGSADPAGLQANPRNWRRHPPGQKEALGGILEEIGWVSGVIVNERTGLLVDGHLRVQAAAERGEKEIPVVYVDLSEEEEATVLAVLDPVGLLAEKDEAAFRDLLESLDPETAKLQKFIADLEAELGVIAPEDPGADGQEEEILLDQAVQHQPGREYVLVTCETEAEWDRLRAVLGLQLVRRGGYKAGSPFDATSVERVIPAARLFGVLGGAR